MMCVDAKPHAMYSKRIVLSLLLAASVLGISACSDSDELVAPEVDPNSVTPPASDISIAETLLQRSDYQTLLRVIEESDLTVALSEDNAGMGWTLFAPSDTAFENDEAFVSLTPEQSAALIGNHLYSGKLSQSDLVPGELQMTQGSVEVVQSGGGTISVGGASIVAGDRLMSNGVIHFVSAVLEPL